MVYVKAVSKTSASRSAECWTRNSLYSPLNGAGLDSVTHVLKDMGITDITIVPEQEYPVATSQHVLIQTLNPYAAMERA